MFGFLLGMDGDWGYRYGKRDDRRSIDGKNVMNCRQAKRVGPGLRKRQNKTKQTGRAGQDKKGLGKGKTMQNESPLTTHCFSSSSMRWRLLERAGRVWASRRRSFCWRLLVASIVVVVVVIVVIVVVVVVAVAVAVAVVVAMVYGAATQQCPT